jgi:hypothetical protein
MIDLTQIAPETIIARGEYATVRGAHEDAKRNLAILCGQLSGATGQVLRQMQPGEDAVPESVESLLAGARSTLDQIEATVQQIESLARQRAELKQAAWGR